MDEVVLHSKDNEVIQMDKTNYDDIIDLARPVSKKHLPMPMEKRAAQFSPFAALTGYEELTIETSSLTTQQSKLSEDDMEALNFRMQQLLQLSPHPQVTIEYFAPDARKDGGSYQTITGTIKKVDTTFHKLIFSDNIELEFDRIRSIDSPLQPQNEIYD